ncbi:hypothetical protein [Brachybacterium sp. FME24]|uniref:hypothetical protein n=1 Tax=Brachybacterium sp. FME24 TaxID=2742605 RepID=UPI0018691797|nr:hypothetical protein [Brachybacterium sp. FME24]
MNADGRSEDYLKLCAEAEECTHLRELGALSDLRDCTSLEELDEALDTTLRYAEFWLAMHYFEVEWLLAEHLDEKERWKNTWGVVRRVWPQAAAPLLRDDPVPGSQVLRPLHEAGRAQGLRRRTH